MAKTLVDFRAEKGLYLKDVAAETGISEEELKAVEESGTVPPHIAQRLIDIYYLPDTYFSEIVISSKVQPKSPMKYFFGVSFVYYIITSTLVSIPMYVNTFGNMLIYYINVFQGKEHEISFADGPFYSIFSSVWTTAVSVISYIMLANFILKRTHYTGDIKKYQFLHGVIPGGATALLSMVTACITTYSYQLEVDGGINFAMLIGQVMNFVISTISILIVVYIHALLFKTAINENTEKKFKTLKTFAIVVTVSSVLAFILNIILFVIEEDFAVFVVIRRLFVYSLDIAVAWAVALTKTDDEKKNKLVFTILPLVSILQSVVFSIIGEIIG